MAGFEVTERFYEIGSLQGIADTEEFLSRKAANRMSYTEEHLRESGGDSASAGRRRYREDRGTLLAQIKAAAGRMFFLGVGGSAANCSHAVNDFRKLAGIECYAPTDNVVGTHRSRQRRRLGEYFRRMAQGQ